MRSNPISIALVVSFVLASPVYGLDIGLEGALEGEFTDNLEDSDDGESSLSSAGILQLGVFGSQNSRRVQAGFAGEIETSLDFDDEDAEPAALTSFAGAADVVLSQSFSWYFGNVLGGVLTLDDEEVSRRNVFVTGPTFEFEPNTSSQITASLLYFNQTQDDTDLAQIYNAAFRWTKDTNGGNAFGIDLSDIFSDEPEADDGMDAVGDNNRFSASAFWSRERENMSYFASAGATRYDVDDQAINGAKADLSITRRFTQASDLSFVIGTDLSDETIAVVDELIEEGEGEALGADGIFQRHSASLNYNINGRLTTLGIGASYVAAQYKLLQNAGPSFDASREDNFTTSFISAI